MTKRKRSNRQRAILDLMHRYCDNVELGLQDRWLKLEVGIYDTAPHEVSSALLARQATLAIQLARSPVSWNGHVAPLFLRAMVDAHISLAWVLRDPVPRAKQFILYGLGQEKLFIEHHICPVDFRTKTSGYRGGARRNSVSRWQPVDRLGFSRTC
jgi:hypothetical protein